MECSHDNTSSKKVKKEILDMTFESKTSVCNNCGAYLRDSEYEKKYMQWLGGLYKERRDNFQTQCYFSKNLIKCAEAYLKEYPGVSTTVIFRALVVSHLSVGQRGTLYLSLKLATETFGTPLVFDQPEDDLDNNFIMTKLIPLLKDVKKYRQVIIVTHNANVVVNGDSEQVIVANNTDEIISYIAGGIESDYKDCEIRRSICNTLEGGKQAFKNRERKYGF